LITIVTENGAWEAIIHVVRHSNSRAKASENLIILEQISFIQVNNLPYLVNMQLMMRTGRNSKNTCWHILPQNQLPGPTSLLHKTLPDTHFTWSEENEMANEYVK
jgi:hypothetical protein